jgi:hypothetical protein
MRRDDEQGAVVPRRRELPVAVEDGWWSSLFGSLTASLLQPTIHPNARRAEGHGIVRTAGWTSAGLPWGNSSRVTQCCTAARLPV